MLLKRFNPSHRTRIGGCYQANVETVRGGLRSKRPTTAAHPRILSNARASVTPISASTSMSIELCRDCADNTGQRFGGATARVAAWISVFGALLLAGAPWLNALKG